MLLYLVIAEAFTNPQCHQGATEKLGRAVTKHNSLCPHLNAQLATGFYAICSLNNLGQEDTRKVFFLNVQLYT